MPTTWPTSSETYFSGNRQRYPLLEQHRNVISREGTFRLSTSRFAGLRHIYRSDLGRRAARLGAGPQCCHCSILHLLIVAAYALFFGAASSPPLMSLHHV